MAGESTTPTVALSPFSGDSCSVNYPRPKYPECVRKKERRSPVCTCDASQSLFHSRCPSRCPANDGSHPWGRRRLGRARRSLCEKFPILVFQPSDPDPDARLSVAAWVKATGVTNVRAPIALDALHSVLANRISRRDYLHQHDPHLTLGGDCGIDQRGGRHTPFEIAAVSLRSIQTRRIRNGPEQPSIRPEPTRSQPELGFARPRRVVAIAHSAGFSEPVITEMPANNLSVVFRRM
jgi:hypothetical protein